MSPQGTCPFDDFLARFPCNHIHGVYGDYVDELMRIGDILGIEVSLLEPG